MNWKCLKYDRFEREGSAHKQGGWVLFLSRFESSTKMADFLAEHPPSDHWAVAEIFWQQ